MAAVFQSSRVKDVLNPDRVILGEEGVIFQIRHLAESNENFVRYDDILDVELDHGTLASNIHVTIRERYQIVTIENFTRSDAEKIKRTLTDRMPKK